MSEYSDNKKIRVLIIADFAADFPGAFIDSIESLGKQIVTEDGKVIYLFTAKRDYHKRLARFGPVYVSDTIKGKRFSLKFCRDALRICKLHKINIVHTQFGLAAPLTGCILNILLGVKHVWHWRNPPPNNTLMFKKIAANIFYNSINQLLKPVNIAISKDIKEKMLSCYRFIREDNIKVINNAIDIQKYKIFPNDRIRNRYGIEDDIVIGMVAHFGPQKDHKTLIDAFKILKGKIKNIKLILVGGPLVYRKKEHEEIQEYVKLNNMEKDVIFAGQWQNVAEVISVMDICVLSSNWEGFGNVVVEYMIMGKPVVATRIGGIQEIVVEGETGFLVNLHDPADMADKILKLLQDKKLREKMGRLGKKRAETLFNMNRWVNEIMNVYSKVLSAA